MEVNDLLESYEREHLRKLKERTLQQCQLGYVVAGDICKFMGQDESPIRPWDLYPELFKEDREAYEIEEYKQKMRAYAAELSRRRREV